MEVFMQDIPVSVTEVKITIEVSRVVHDPESYYNSYGTFNFNVYLHRKRKNVKHGSSGRSNRTGCITFPLEEIARRFLDDCQQGKVVIELGGRPIRFKQSKNPPRPDILDRIRSTSFPHREVLVERSTLQEAFSVPSRISEVQFGWDCRDETFSVEWTRCAYMTHHIARFDEEKRRLLIDLEHREETMLIDLEHGRETIEISFSQISAAYTNLSETSGVAVAFLTLRSPPGFLKWEISDSHSLIDELLGIETVIKKRRLSSLLDDDHARVASFVSTSMRLIFVNKDEFHKFRRNWSSSKLKLRLLRNDFVVEHRNLFSRDVLLQVKLWIKQLEWPLAFHLYALVTNGSLDPRELLNLRPRIEHLRTTKGLTFLERMLPAFHVELDRQWYSDASESHELAERCFDRIPELLMQQEGRRSRPSVAAPADGVFNCFHVTITPTRMLLYGPYPERTNRVTRRYAQASSNFIRVNFVDEFNQQLRFDRDEDGDSFIKERVGGILRHGLRVAGHDFQFLAYSQSALKDHAVWFVTPFWDEITQTTIDAAAIRNDLGRFDNNPYDKRLVFCPARYAARLSQAFTSTDMSVTVQADEVTTEDDIKTPSGSYCFTDGVGTISKELAHLVIQTLRRRKRRGLIDNDPLRLPVSAFQIRFQGCKGMVSVDHTLTGRKLVLRPSMIKFDAYNTSDIGIASFFSKPSKLFLNRPLIMLLEGLGVHADVFLEFQRKAVQKARDAEHSIEAFGKVLEEYGLGSAFRVPSVLQSLANLDCDFGSDFESDLIKLAIFHILSELKHRARIPVPGYTLVGVADIHRYLQEGQVFVCIQEPNEERKYLEGPVLITRSPVIHPGDVQIAHAIGAPPPESPFAIEPLQNTVVFSVLGSRPLPSCLGGGDLDGDVYNVTMDKRLHPTNTRVAASYDPAKRHEINHPSTINDVADFVVNYIINDNLGVIAQRWLFIADQSEKGILDNDCIKLAQLHSDAVDYPKTGTPVSMRAIPKALKRRPDWSHPEIILHSREEDDYYISKKALGQLYRDIHLHDPISHRRGQRRHGRGERRAGNVGDVDEDSDDEDAQLLPAFRAIKFTEDTLYDAVITRTRDFVEIPSSDTDSDELYMTIAEDMFKSFASQLEIFCASHTLSNRNERLAETEAILGVISERTTQPRRRRELTSKLRELTTQLVTDCRWDLQMGEEGNKDPRKCLSLALIAWELSRERLREKEFGARSFWWVSLGAIFESIRRIEEEDDDKELLM